MSDKPSLLEFALTYWRRGWSIVPAKGKRPTINWTEFQSRRPTDLEVRDWFAAKRTLTSGRKPSGIAVLLGTASGGLACRDFDKAERYETWAESQRDLAKILPTAATGRGYHVYFRTAEEVYVNLGDGELRADRLHVVIVPPSRHPSGVHYRWIVPIQEKLPILDPVSAGFLPPTRSEVDHVAPVPILHTVPAVNPPAPSLLSPSCPEFSELTVSSVFSVLSPADKAKVDEAIRRTLPIRQGTRARSVFELARWLQAIPACVSADPRSFRPIVKEWHRLALPTIGTKEFEATWIDFLNAWRKVKFPAGTAPLDQMIAQARSEPLPAAALRYETRGLRELVALVANLQRWYGDKPFFLDCRSAGRLLGVSHVTAWQWLFLLEQEGILQRVSTGEFGKKKANEFHYLG